MPRWEKKDYLRITSEPRRLHLLLAAASAPGAIEQVATYALFVGELAKSPLEFESSSSETYLILPTCAPPKIASANILLAREYGSFRK